MSEFDAALTGSRSPDWEEASRPSKTNCTTAQRDDLPAGEATWRGHWWKQKNALLDQFVDDFSERATRPVSVRGGTKLREECTGEKADGGYRGATWSTVLNEFLKWYNDYRHAHLVFNDPNGEVVRTQMPNSHQPKYGDKYYARLKALERQITAEFDDLHVAMLTLTGSTKNGRGGWRCPADHLRDVIESWRPDRGRGVYHALRDSLEDHRWEYALVVEKHQSGYGHVHVAVFVEGEIEESDFHSAIDAHLRACEIAHRDAHDYYDPDPEKRPISVRAVDTDLDPEEYEAGADVGNVGSYIGEYVGAYGKPLFDRSIEELAFRAVTWATGTQVVRFSNGANALIREELAEEDDESDEITVRRNSEFESEEEIREDFDESRFVVKGDKWTLAGVGRVGQDGESIHEMDRATIKWRKIDEASHLDPPNPQPPNRPVRPTTDMKIVSY